MSEADRPIGVDLFCGVGGMSLGFEQAGFHVQGAVDLDPIHVECYKGNFPGSSVVTGDISKLSGDVIRREARLGNKQIDVVFGGPPCQGFSFMGKREADDPRNLLLGEFARLVAELGPTYFVVENVAGLMAGPAKQVLARFIRLVRRAGYAVVEPVRVLAAEHFAVPQRRRRVFILGCKKGVQPPEYPSTHTGPWKEATPTVWDAIGDLPIIDEFPALLDSDVLHEPLGKPSAYAAVLRDDRREPDDASLPRDRNGRGLTGCMRTRHGAETIKRFAATLPGHCEPVSRFFRLAKDGLAPTQRAGTGPSNGSFMAPRPIHPVHPRCVSVREAARLHSFPDWFTFHATKWHAFRQIGNAVPPRLARAVAAVIARCATK
ncbi:MAG TPA: DNA cytosine methyltransferase [Planctomycetota bacterium]|nr:DNA cytosine methyltransferase [Planctomycetota bacterium]